MPYYGEVEINVKLKRQGYGIGGSEYGIVGQDRILLTETEARMLLDRSIASPLALDMLRNSLADIFKQEEKEELQQRWNNISYRNLSTDQVKKILEIVEKA